MLFVSRPKVCTLCVVILVTWLRHWLNEVGWLLLTMKTEREHMQFFIFF